MSITQERNVRNDSDLAKINQEFEIIKKTAENYLKIVEEHREPLFVYSVIATKY